MLYNANALLWNDSMYSNEYNIYTKSKLSYIGYHVYLRINIWQHYSIQNICCRCNRFVWLRCILVREWLYILCWNLTIHQYTFSKKLWYEKHCHHFEYIIFFPAQQLQNNRHNRRYQTVMIFLIMMLMVKKMKYPGLFHMMMGFKSKCNTDSCHWR